jgi:shikimate dehydrogenase
VINGNSTLIAHFGDPIGIVKAPLIYNPWFDSVGIDARVVPMGVRSDDYATTMPAVMRMTNVRGALVTMPHKVTTVALLDRVTTAVRIAQSCNAIRKAADGTLEGDLFDGAGFVRGLERKSVAVRGSSALVVGAGGVGSAIAAALAAAGVARLRLHDARPAVADQLAGRLREHYPALDAQSAAADAAGHDIVVNATPLGMEPDDPLPVDPAQLRPDTFVGEVVMKQAVTPLLRAAQARGCRTQVGTDMLFEQIPLYLEYFGFGSATPDELRAVARLA